MVINGGNLIIGKECIFGENSVINVFADVIIGNNVMTSDRISIITNIHNYTCVDIPVSLQKTDSDSVEIGDGTWIGINAVILPGTKIGRNCVIAAGAVVKGNYPNYCVIAGVPAKIIKQYDDTRKEWVNIRF